MYERGWPLLIIDERTGFMDWQTVGNALYGLVLLLGGTLMKLLHSNVKQLEDKVDALPNIYARRDDVKDGFSDMKQTLLRIESKLDMKADRHA